MKWLEVEGILRNRMVRNMPFFFANWLVAGREGEIE